ncbi:MAG: hypothetical protein ABJA20_02095 [Novosphingobium sp.]
MLRLIMSNRWLAAIWALMTLISIASFVRQGSPSMQALDGAASKLHAQRQQQAEVRKQILQPGSDEQDPELAGFSETRQSPQTEGEPEFGEGSDPTPSD